MGQQRGLWNTWEDELRFRLDAGDFVLDRNQDEFGVGYIVRNSRGDIVFGAHPRLYSATLDQVERFLTAQRL
jgi:hypothetical protein